MGRHEQREQIFKLLFRVEFNPPEDMGSQVALFFEDGEEAFSEKDISYIQEKFAAVQDKLSELDKLISDKTDGWTTSRMGKIELTILRLGAYEILYDEDVPDSVAINEAVEIAKEYGQDMSGGFVNAILAKIVKLKG